MNGVSVTFYPNITAYSFTGPFTLTVQMQIDGRLVYDSPPLLLKADNARDAIAEADHAVDGLWARMQQEIPELQGVDIKDERDSIDEATLRYIKESGALDE